MIGSVEVINEFQINKVKFYARFLEIMYGFTTLFPTFEGEFEVKCVKKL